MASTIANPQSDGLIKEGDQVVVKREKNLKVVPVRRNCKLWIERSKFFLDSVIGFPYGTSFEVVNQKLVKVQNVDVGADLDLDGEEDEEGTRDNRNLTDTNTNQKLSSDEIRSMKKDGMHGEEIIEQLIQNSATFNQKNEFAKQKYIKKKKKKYVPVVTVLKPTARLLLEMYYNKGPSRICNLRLDSLAQILTYVNARAGNKMLVVESCVGLVVGAVMERMGGHGTVIQLYSGSAAVQQAVISFDFPREAHNNLHSFPLSHVSQLRRPGSRGSSIETTAISVESNMAASTCDQLGTCNTNNATSTTALSSNSMTSGTSSPTDTTSRDLQQDVEEAADIEVAETNCDTDGAEPDDRSIDTCNNTNGSKPDDRNNTVQDTDVHHDGDLAMTDEHNSNADEQNSACKSSDTSDGPKSKGIKRKYPDMSKEREQKVQSKRKYIQEIKEKIEKCDSDGLIVVSKFNPVPIVMSLIEFVQPSRPIAVFCQYKEPLMDLYIKLRDRGGVVLLRMSETWLRGYQILPDRTHPKIKMSGTGGYLLTGTTVEMDET